MSKTQAKNTITKRILDVAKGGKLADLLIALSENDGKILRTESQKYFCGLINEDHLMISDLEENSEVAQGESDDASESESDSATAPVTNNDNPQKNTSVLLTAIENNNVEIKDYLITYCSHLIQQLPFDHQIKISTVAFEKNQLDALYDLLRMADFPFPENFEANQEKCAEHEGMCKILKERIEFKAAIEAENFEEIDKFAKPNPNLKIVYMLNNTSTMKHALKSKKFKVYFYLKSLGFCAVEFNVLDEVLDGEELEEAKLQAEIQRSKSINEARSDALNSANLLCTRSFIHDKRIKWEQDAEFRIKIKQWYIDVYKVAPDMIDIAASCEDLKIIYDFESNYVDNIDLESSKSLGLTHRISKWIFIGAKLSDKNGKVTKQREQEIKGTIAHELCHYVMCLVYNNKYLPYYENATDIRDEFEEVVKSISNGFQTENNVPNDECNQIISSVFTAYFPKQFHLELIVRVVHILAEFDDNKEKSECLEKKYEKLFSFWNKYVHPELQIYRLRNKFVKKLNGICGLLQKILNQNYKFKNIKDIEYLIESKLVIVTTNIPNFLLVNINKYLHDKYGMLKDSKYFFTKPSKLNNNEIWNDFGKICNTSELSIIVDCTKGFPEYIRNIFVNNELNFIFVASNKQQCEKLSMKIKGNELRQPLKVEINYCWSDLTEKSQNMLLKTKINFQNNSQVSLMDLLKCGQSIENENQDLNEIIDGTFLNLLVEKQDISINTKLENEFEENKFTFIFQLRSFLNKQRDGNRIRFSQVKLLSEVKNQKYVLISDMAGNGKSWAIKNITNTLREQKPTNSVTYVDLKQFIDEFKEQEGEPEFSTFIVEKILKPKRKFESKIFQKLYKNGKVFILFDGFDEIAPNYAEFVSKLAQNFRQNGGNQLWIATRDYFEVDLKETKG